MTYLFVVALIGGAVSVLTPCVLPLLPAILAVSAGEGRRRVWGVAAGIEVSFFGLAILLAGAIRSLGLPPDVFRYVAAVVLGGFGVILIVPRFHKAFTAAMSRWTSGLSGSRPQRSGFAGGFLAGLPLGLVWAPCAGPILAGITVAASTSRYSSQALLTMTAYAAGMFGPLAVVILGGQRLSRRLRAALPGGRAVLVPMGVLLLATAVLVGAGGLNRVNQFIARRVNLTSTPTASLERRALTPTTGNRQGRVDVSRVALEANGYPELGRLADLGPAPDFDGISRWYNSGGRSLSRRSLRGKVVLIDFWTYSCINCIRTLPYVTGWYERYKDDGLVIVGVHTPEFQFEKDPRNVGRAVTDFGITYPVALDAEYGTWERYYNHYWPAHYLIDRDWHLRSVHYGEGAYSRTENEIRTLLGMKATPSRRDKLPPAAITPETYLGSLRAERFRGSAGGRDGFAQSEAVYAVPRSDGGDVELAADTWSYAGEWRVGPESAIAGADARIYIHFRGQNVFLVAGPASDGSGSIRASGVDGGKDVTVDRYRLYTVRAGDHDDALLRLEISPGVEVFAFTFG